MDIVLVVSVALSFITLLPLSFLSLLENHLRIDDFFRRSLGEESDALLRPSEQLRQALVDEAELLVVADCTLDDSLCDCGILFLRWADG